MCKDKVNHYIVHSYLFFNAKIESACQWESSKSKLVKVELN
jgi:hypothetical protein